MKIFTLTALLITLSLPTTLLAKPVLLDSKSSNPGVLTFQHSDLSHLNLSIQVTLDGDAPYAYETSEASVQSLDYLGEASFFSTLQLYIRSNPEQSKSDIDQYLEGTNLTKILEDRNFRETIDHLLYIFDSRGALGLIDYLLEKPDQDDLSKGDLEPFKSKDIFSKLRIRPGTFELKDSIELNDTKINLKARIQITQTSLLGEEVYLITLLSVRQTL